MLIIEVTLKIIEIFALGKIIGEFLSVIWKKVTGSKLNVILRTISLFSKRMCNEGICKSINSSFSTHPILAAGLVGLMPQLWGSLYKSGVISSVSWLQNAQDSTELTETIAFWCVALMASYLVVFKTPGKKFEGALTGYLLSIVCAVGNDTTKLASLISCSVLFLRGLNCSYDDDVLRDNEDENVIMISMYVVLSPLLLIVTNNLFSGVPFLVSLINCDVNQCFRLANVLINILMFIFSYGVASALFMIFMGLFVIKQMTCLMLGPQFVDLCDLLGLSCLIRLCASAIDRVRMLCRNSISKIKEVFTAFLECVEQAKRDCLASSST